MDDKTKKDYYLNMPSKNKDEDAGVGASNFHIR